MDIALIHYRLVHYGGLENRLKNYAGYLVSQGHRVTVIFARTDGKLPLPGSVEQVMLSPGLAPRPLRPFAFDRKLGRFMQQRRFDLSLSLGRTSHQQMVLCPGNHLGYLQALGKTSLSLTDRFQVRSDVRAYQGSRTILAASRMMQEEVIRLYGIPGQKVKLLYPPLHTDDYPAPQPGEKEAARRELGLETGRTTFLFVSMGHSRKGLPLLLELFGRPEMQDKDLLVIGYPALPVSLPNVRYMGYHTRPRNFYLAADFLVHPSVYEPYGQVVAESLQCETPVILSRFTGASELLGPGEGLVLPDMALPTWSNALSELKPGSFDISPNFAARNRVTLQDHVRQLLEYAGGEK